VRFYTTEGPVDYGSYCFSYRLWLQLEEGDAPEEAYERGYLPWSADADGPHSLFYCARSLRVPVGELKLSKSRRYDHRRWQEHGLRRERLPKTAFLDRIGEKQVVRLARKWMKHRYEEPYLSEARLRYLLDSPLFSGALLWTRSDGKPTAFAFLVEGENLLHYWFVFYSAKESDAAVNGSGFLTDFVHFAREAGVKHAYLGTGYGQKSRYKWRGIRPVEFLDGGEWSRDREELARRQANDG
jgi:hypothetical protein